MAFTSRYTGEEIDEALAKIRDLLYAGSTSQAFATAALTARGIVTIGVPGVSGGRVNSADGIFINIDSDNSGTTAQFEIAANRTGVTGGFLLMRITEAGAVSLPGAVTTGYLTAYGDLTVSGDADITGDVTVIGANSIKGSYGAGEDSMSLAIGDGALATNKTGYHNVAIGKNALAASVSGSDNVAIGSDSFVSNVSGSNNCACGYQSLTQSTVATGNTAIGSMATFANTSGSGNACLGAQSLYNGITGSCNTAVGAAAMYDSATTVISVAEMVAGTEYEIVTQGTTTYSQFVASGATPTSYESAPGVWVVNTFTGIRFTANSTPCPGDGTVVAVSDIDLCCNNNTAIGYGTGGGIVTGSNNTIVGANVSGLDADLTGNIILASGDGEIKAQHDGTAWHLTGDTITYGQNNIAALHTAPTSASDTGVTGEIRVTADYIYVCIDTDTWVRAALATWT